MGAGFQVSIVKRLFSTSKRIEITKRLVAVCGMIVATGFAYHYVQRDTAAPTWPIPAENQLNYAQGSFDIPALGFSRKGPYTFITDKQETLRIGSDPEWRFNDVLLTNNIFPRDVAGRHLKIGYFYAANPYNSSLYNVLMSVNADGRSLLSYETRKAELESWRTREQGINEDSLPFDLLLVFTSAILVLIILIKKLNQIEDGLE